MVALCLILKMEEKSNFLDKLSKKFNLLREQFSRDQIPGKNGKSILLVIFFLIWHIESLIDFCLALDAINFFRKHMICKRKKSLL